MPATRSGTSLDLPMLWLQSDSKPQAEYVRVRDGLMGGVRRGADVLVIGAASTRASPIRSPISPLLGAACSGMAPGRADAVDDITWESGEVSSAFVGPYLGGPT